METFAYGNDAVDFLSKNDKRMADAISRIGHVSREIWPDLFQGLIWSIVGQQISGAAQASVWKRFESGLGEVSVQSVISAGREKIRSFGVSDKKAEWIVSSAEKFASGEIDSEQIAKLSDSDAIDVLTNLDGIGVWTAEMLLIFVFGRQNILSLGDFGIRKGMRMLYGWRFVDKIRYQRLKKRYAPYGTIASFYLWAIAGGALSELTDPGQKTKK